MTQGHKDLLRVIRISKKRKTDDMCHASFCACYILQNKPVATQNVSENKKDGNRVALLLIPVIYFAVASICFVSLLVLAWLTAACHCGNLPSCRRSPIKERKSKSEHAKERTSRRRRRKTKMGIQRRFIDAVFHSVFTGVQLVRPPPSSSIWETIGGKEKDRHGCLMDWGNGKYREAQQQQHRRLHVSLALYSQCVV